MSNITTNWKIIDSIPARRSDEVRAAIEYLKEVPIGKTVHIDADSESIAKRAAKYLNADDSVTQFRFRVVAESDGGGVYATKISG